MKINHQKTLALGLFLISFLVLPNISQAATSLTQNTITWTFDQDYVTGQFVNGDYWVIDPGGGVIVSGISPVSVTSDDTENGSMINPLTNSSLQGYDEGVLFINYDDSLNVALDVNPGNPLILNAGQSLVSSVSRTPNPSTDYSSIDKMAVLTCLSSTPTEGSFRPPFVGTDKTIRFNESDINYNILGSLDSLTGFPSLSTQTDQFQFLQYDTGGLWTKRSLYPYSHMPDYGADIAGRISPALLSLNCDYTNQQKRDLLVYMLQYAIDISGALIEGAEWGANGGHGHGRKSVLALGAMVFNDTIMKDQLNASENFKFGEDQHIFYVTEYDQLRNVSGWSSEPGPVLQYSTLPIGTPEWGWAHAYSPINDNAALTAMYRDYYGRNLGGLLSSLIIGAETFWNKPEVFDYIERVKPEMEPPCNLGGTCYYNASSWELDMYDAYWDTYRNSAVIDLTPPAPPIGLNVL